MKIESFLSATPQTPYAPTWNFKIGTSFCDDIDTVSFSKFLLKKEKEIKKLPSSVDMDEKFTDGYTGLGKNSTTAKFQHYNILAWDDNNIKKLKQNIVKNLITYNDQCKNKTPDDLWIQCWFNVLRFGQKIKPHLHSTKPCSYLSGHFNVQVENTSTVYMLPINQINDPEVIDIRNNPREMTIFPSYIFHYTTPHYSLKPRITIAFDISYYKYSNNWVKL
jgi:hypothetical protein